MEYASPSSGGADDIFSRATQCDTQDFVVPANSDLPEVFLNLCEGMLGVGPDMHIGPRRVSRARKIFYKEVLPRAISGAEGVYRWHPNEEIPPEKRKDIDLTDGSCLGLIDHIKEVSPSRHQLIARIARMAHETSRLIAECSLPPKSEELVLGTLREYQWENKQSRVVAQESAAGSDHPRLVFIDQLAGLLFEQTLTVIGLLDQIPRFDSHRFLAALRSSISSELRASGGVNSSVLGLCSPWPAALARRVYDLTQSSPF